MPEITLSIAQVPEGDRPTPEQVKVPDTSVDILYPTPGTVHAYWHQAINRATAYDRNQGWDNIKAERAFFSGANISKARNKLVSQALEGDSEWFLFLDTDMVIDDVTIPSLLCAAECSGADVIGALCVYESFDGPIPTIYHFGNFDAGEVTRVLFDYPDGQILQVAATGTACLLVKRSVFEHIAAENPGNPYPWFREEVINGQWISEDIMFCLLANAHGHPVFVDCTTPIGHAKGKKIWYPEDIRNQVGFPGVKNVAIIPVKDRLDLTSQLVHQLREQGETDEIIILDNGSGKKTKNWLSSQKDLTVFDMPDVGIHTMWNKAADYVMGQGRSRNINLVFLNNDVSLGPNFVSGLTQTLRSEKTLIAVSANYDGREIVGEFEETDQICGARYDGTGGFAGFAFAVRIEFFTSGYKFPEECMWWNGDVDLINMIRYSGGKVGISSRATCEHLDGGGQTAGDPVWSKFREQTQKDKEAFNARWEKILKQEEAKNV
jgi:GT2 family glycosyltransferase